MYLNLIYLNVFLIFVLNLAVDFSFYTVFTVIFCFVKILLPSLLCAILIRKMPTKWFGFNNKYFVVGDKEKMFLQKIGVKKWKNSVPDFGQTVNFKKNKLLNPANKEYLEKFLLETCYGEVLHKLCIYTSWLSLLFISKKFLINIALPIVLCYTLYNIPPILIQRYNRPRLVKHYEKICEIKYSGEKGYDNNDSLRCAR